MNNKILSVILIIVLFAGIFTAVASAKNLNFLCSKKESITVTLKNDAKMDAAKDEISKIPQIKIIDIKYRDKEWSKMVNKMDLPRMENPFKNEFTLMPNKNANIKEISDKINGMDFVEKVEYSTETKCIGK